MNPQRLIVIALAAGAVVLTAALLLAPRLAAPKALSGYVEGEALYLGAPVAGSLTQISVRRGDVVEAGAPLFQVDPRQLSAQQQQALQQLAAARAQAADARRGQRPVELAVLDAQIDAAAAALRDAEANYRRIAPLAGTGAVSLAERDNAKFARDQAAANLAAAQKRRATATLGAREDQVRAADAQVHAAEAAVADAGARLSDLAPAAPARARVEDTFAQKGEWVAANQPVVSLLPDDRITIRFFVPERQVARFGLGRSVHFACDSCGAGLSATVSYVSPRPEFTPPVIYSLEARDRLVFLIEARPAHPERLTPGLPVDVTPLEAGP